MKLQLLCLLFSISLSPLSLLCLSPSILIEMEKFGDRLNAECCFFPTLSLVSFLLQAV